MGMYSTFDYEEDIYVKDKELIAFCKAHPKEEENFYQEEILKWYESNDVFSFEIFNGWKIQGYWYPEFLKLLKVLELFLDYESPLNKNLTPIGIARFTYEEGQPFQFCLNLKNKSISVEYVPVVWETMDIDVGFENEKFKEAMQVLQFKEKL